MANGGSNNSRILLPVLIAIVAIAAGVCAYLFLLAPKMGELAAGGAYDPSGLQSGLDSDTAYAARAEAAVAAYDNLNSQLRQKVRAIVPSDVDEPGIMATIDAIARSNNMVARSIDVTPIEDEVGEMGQVAARVSVNIEGGDYSDFKLFLADVERSQRLFDVEAVVFTPMTAMYSLQLKAFYLPQDANKAATPLP